jgi:hypothetical protein
MDEKDLLANAIVADFAKQFFEGETVKAFLEEWDPKRPPPVADMVAFIEYVRKWRTGYTHLIV